MGEQVRSQPIVTNRSEINGGTRNYVETLTLLFTKLHLEPYQSQTRVCLQQAWLRKDYHSQKRREGKTSYTVAVKISSCLNSSFTSASLYVNTSTHPHKDTHSDTHPLKKIHAHTHTMQFFQSRMLENLSDSHKEKQIYLFIWVQSNYRHNRGAWLWHLFRKSGVRVRQAEMCQGGNVNFSSFNL